MSSVPLASPRNDAGRPRASARGRILEAAREVAEESGAGHLSLDAVAKKAGVSKGGLLYHFHSKNDLMRALVEHHVDLAERDIGAAEEASASPNAVAAALIQKHSDEFECRTPPSGLLVAFAESPALLEPVRAYQKRIVERIRASADDPELSLIAFLVLEGIRAHDIFELNCLTQDERHRILERLMEQLESSAQDSAQR